MDKKTLYFNKIAKVMDALLAEDDRIWPINEKAKWNPSGNKLIEKHRYFNTPGNRR